MRLLKWILCRRGHIVTCQIDRAGSRYRVSVLPHGQHKSRLVEMFDANLTAFQRHAALVAGLRDCGWTTVDYG
jgi:hypothetical protein